MALKNYFSYFFFTTFLSKNYSQNTTGIELCYAFQANNLISDSALQIGSGLLNSINPLTKVFMIIVTKRKTPNVLRRFINLFELKLIFISPYYRHK